MSLKEKVGALFAAVGPRADLLVVDVYPSENLWHVAVDEHTILFAELDEARGVLVLSAELGRPAPDRQAKLHALALRYSNLWAANGGVHLGLADENGSLELLCRLSPEGLDAGRFGVMLKEFAGRVAGWRAIVAAEGTPAAQADDIGALGFAPIRL